MRRVVHVVACASLPPGGGKSTLVAALRERGFAVASSDECRARGQDFSAALATAARGSTVVAADKNFPDVTGLRKLVRTLTGLERGPDSMSVRLHLVVPSALGDSERQLCWERIAARPPSHIALHTHNYKKGGKAHAMRIFADFWRGASDTRAHSARLPGALLTDAFFRTSEQPITDELANLADEITRRCAAPVSAAGAAGEEEGAGEAGASPAESGVSTAELARALEGTGSRGGGQGGGGGGGGNLRYNWACARVDGRSQLHVTLVPPPAAGGGRARVAALQRLQAQAAGRAVVVHVPWLHIARPRGRGARGSAFSFWEVSAVDGLEKDEHYEPQAVIYHITDVDSLSRKVKPKMAAVLMRALREHGAGPQYAPVTHLPKPAYDVEHIRLDEPLVLRATVHLMPLDPAARC